MKRYISHIIISAAALLAGCTAQEGGQPQSEYGFIRMSGITADITRAAATDDFIITVLDENQAEAGSWRMTEVPEKISLPAGNYTVTAASSSAQQPAAWEAPYYYGSQAAQVVSHRTTEVSVICTLQNIRVTVDYSEDLKAALGEEFSTRVQIGDGTLDFEKGDTRAGYFMAPQATNTMHIEFDGMVDGVRETFSMTAGDLTAGQWRRVTLTISPQAGEGSLGAVIERWTEDEELHNEK